MKMLNLAVILVFAATSQGWARTKIEVSKLDRKMSSEQRAAFSDWLSYEDFNGFYEEQKEKGRYILYVEENGKKEYRGIFGEIDPRGWYYILSANEASMLESYRRHTSNGMRLMTLSKSRGDRYSAVWVAERTFDQVGAQLAPFGIGLASVDE